MAQPLLIPDTQNATIEELKQVSPVGSNETTTRCTAIQMLLAGASRVLVRYFDYGQCLMAQMQNNPLAQLATDVFAAVFARPQSH